MGFFWSAAWALTANAASVRATAAARGEREFVMMISCVVVSASIQSGRLRCPFSEKPGRVAFVHELKCRNRLYPHCVKVYAGEWPPLEAPPRGVAGREEGGGTSGNGGAARLRHGLSMRASSGRATFAIYAPVATRWRAVWR